MEPINLKKFSYNIDGDIYDVYFYNKRMKKISESNLKLLDFDNLEVLSFEEDHEYFVDNKEVQYLKILNVKLNVE